MKIDNVLHFFNKIRQQCFIFKMRIINYFTKSQDFSPVHNFGHRCTRILKVKSAYDIDICGSSFKSFNQLFIKILDTFTVFSINYRYIFD